MLKTLSTVGLILLLAGCKGYIDGSSRTIGQFTDDAGIQAAVKTALVNDAEVKGMSINVEVNRNVVSLYGRVESEQKRAKALELAGGVRGVTKVEDRLTLVVPK